MRFYVGPIDLTPYYLMKHYRFTNTEIIIASSYSAFIEYKTQPTKSTGLSFEEWLNQLDAFLYNHINKTHTDFDYDWEWHWDYNDEPAMWKAEDIIRRALPHSFNDVWQHYNHFA